MIVTASKLNVRSGPGTAFRVMRSLGQNTSVDVLETNGDWAWVDPGEGWVSRAYLEAPVLAAAPSGLKGITAMFGVPGSPEASGGRVVLPAPLKLSWRDARITRFACHVKMEPVFSEVLHELHRRGLWSRLAEFGGCYEDRETRAGTKKSTHAWGIAIDLNPGTNPQGGAGDMPSAVVRCFEEAGFTWGGRWKGASRDPMHFQFAKDY